MSRALSLFTALTALAGCSTAPEVDDGLVAWKGYVYTGPQADVTWSASTADGATVQFLPDEGEDGAVDPIDAEEPYEDYPGYWSARVPPSTAMTIRVNTTPAAVWRVTSPAVDASWFAGALLGADGAELDALLAALGEPAHGDAAVVVGSPWDDGWDCAAVLVGDATPDCFLVDADGVVSAVTEGELSYFVAPEVDPGDVTVDSGLGGVDTYPLAAGEVGMAFWFTGAP